MPFFIVFFFAFVASAFAVDQVQPTPYDLIRSVWPMTWDTSATDEGGTVESFSKFTPNENKHNMVPKVGSQPQDFVPNGFIPDTLDQAYRDAQNLRIGRIRVNQAGYLPDDPEMQFYYVSAGNCSETFSIVDLDGKEVATGGTFVNSGSKTTSSWVIRAGTDAATADQGRYDALADAPEGELCVGHIVDIAGPLSLDTRYRIKVLKQYSATFIISPRVYSMVRDALIKFYGVNRSGNSESWFHKPSHLKDGGGPVVNNVAGGGDISMSVADVKFKEGDLQGGWYDCGDHLKESLTQGYALMSLSVMAAGNPDRDEDHYAYNHGETMNTDGIPDMLREVKHGVDFFLRAYRAANGVIDNMGVSIGDMKDHQWWSRPENNDALGPTVNERGAPHQRPVRLGELNANVSAEIAVGLAVLAKDYAPYDKAFADTCRMVAHAMYDFARNRALGNPTYGAGVPFKQNVMQGAWGSPAYSGANSFYDDISVAAIAMHYGTYPDSGMKYLNDAVEDPVLGKEKVSEGIFRGGWFASGRDNRKPNNTDWASVQTFALYGFYKMLLKNDSIANHFGISHDERMWYIEALAYTLAENASAHNGGGPTATDVPLFSGERRPISGTALWYQMPTQSDWIYNRYMSGNTFDLFAYYDVTKDLEGVKLPQHGVEIWNAEKVKQLAINQLNYQFGVNPWDVSFVMGIGDKNDAHPHHRAANPEGRNMPGAGYKYNPPVGGFFGGVRPDGDNAWVPTTLSWEDYFKSEICIDATATLIAATTTTIHEEDRNRAPSKINVEIRYVGSDSAIIKIGQDMRGPAMLLYSTNETGPFNIPVKDTVPSVSHEIHMTGLQNGTTYFFKVIAINARSEAYATKWLVDSTATPFSFTTLVSPPGDASIQNVKVCNLSADSAEIMWYTPNGQYESKMYWDTVQTSYDKMRWNTGDTNADVSGIPTNFHYVKIGGLQEQTTYYYCVESNGARRCIDEKNQPLKFTTPVTRYDFDVTVYQYEFTGLDFLNINLVNNEERAFDELELRFYVTAKEEDMQKGESVNNQAGSCPLLIDLDICQAYDEAGFNKPCVDKDGNDVDRSIRDALRNSVPIKLEDTYNTETGTYQWYIPIPLAGTLVKGLSRLRADFGFSRGIHQANSMDCETLREPANKRFSATSGDWTWSPHKREIDGADYEGLPNWPKDQGDIEHAPVNPYVVVYRKGEFISGFSPSLDEMMTKKADYKMTVAYNPPFDVSNGSYVQLDSPKSTAHIKGTAYITESGYVTSIWVNGVPLTDEELASAAVYNEQTLKYDLDIPVKMTIGTNKIDVTVFAGPLPGCDECQKNGGCAFVNRTYYVQYSKGNRTAGTMQLIREDGNSVSSPVLEDPMNFKIFVSDRDNAKHESIKAKIYNSRTKTSTEVTLKRTNEALGYFESSMLSAVKSDGADLPKVTLLGGDTVTVIYIDAEDDEDSTSQMFYATPTTPIPELAVLVDSDCNSAADLLNMTFSGSKFDANQITLDTVTVYMNMPDGGLETYILPTAGLKGDALSLSLGSAVAQNAAPSGKIVLSMTESGAAKTAEIEITDGIAPTLTSFTILENENHANTLDTLKVVFSEPVNLPSKTEWPFVITNGGAEVSQAGISVRSATTQDDGKSWQYIIEGNTNGDLVKKDYKVEVSSEFLIVDFASNKLSGCNAPITVTESVRPVQARYAKISDATGDGQPDEIYIQYARVLREKDMFDTIDVYWGNPEVYQAFAKPAGGWKLDTLLGDKVARTSIIVDPDSSKGKWSVREQTFCDTKEVPDTTYTTKITVDSITGDTTKTQVVSSISTKTVKDNSSCKTTVDSTFIPATTETIDSVQDQYSVIRISIPTGTFKNKTYGSREGKGMLRSRQGPMGGFFDDNTVPLSDDCPPIILTASWSSVDMGDGGQRDKLVIEMSEPLDSLPAQPYLIERKRDGAAGVHIEKAHLDNIIHSPMTSTTFIYNYNDDDNVTTTVHIGDEIRLVPDAGMSFYKDAAGLFAGAETPWVPVIGVVSNLKIKVAMDQHVFMGGVENAYGGQVLNKNQSFRLSLKNKGGDNLVIAEGENKLKPVSSTPVANYVNGGPVFRIDLTLPEALEKTKSGEYKRDYSVKLEFDIFTNLGSFVNKVSYTFSISEWKEYITANSTVSLYLEWCSIDGAPISEKGRMIGTGPYIAKYSITTKSPYMAESPDDGDNIGTKKREVTGTMSFGFRREAKK